MAPRSIYRAAEWLIFHVKMCKCVDSFGSKATSVFQGSSVRGLATYVIRNNIVATGEKRPVLARLTNKRFNVAAQPNARAETPRNPNPVK